MTKPIESFSELEILIELAHILEQESDYKRTLKHKIQYDES